MNLAFQATKTALHGTAEMAVAGQRAVCDPSGALYLDCDRILVVSDLHFEKGSSFARRGMLLPPYDTATTLAALAKVIARYPTEGSLVTEPLDRSRSYNDVLEEARKR